MMANIVPFEYQGQPVRFNTDGWINATEAAGRFGKRPVDWLKQDETRAYLEILADQLNCDPESLLRTRRGRYNSGTWLHPKLAVRFAQWLDMRFSVWCDMQIDALIRQGMAAAGHEHLIGLLLRPEASDWKRRFPLDYYQALARVTNTRFEGHEGGTPSLYGQLTKKWVYQVIMPLHVLGELYDRCGPQEKLHQWMTDGGAQILDQQIATVTVLAKSSTDLRDFEARCRRTFGVPGQLSLAYPIAS